MLAVWPLLSGPTVRIFVAIPLLSVVAELPPMSVNPLADYQTTLCPLTGRPPDSTSACTGH